MFPSAFSYVFEKLILLASHPATLPGWIFRNEIHSAEAATIANVIESNLGVQRQFPDGAALGIG